MKCEACKYEYYRSFFGDIEEIGDESFIKIEIEKNFRFTVFDYGYRDNQKPVELYACPKCKTIRLEG